MRPVHLIALLATASACIAGPTEPRQILFIAGAPSHGWGEHEFADGCRLLADALNASGLNLTATVSEGWPEDPARIDTADALVLYSDGLDDHVATGRHAELAAFHRPGTGITVLHFALEPSPGPLADVILNAVAGRFDTDWSVNAMWRLEDTVLIPHPVTLGVEPFSIHDEFYFHMNFTAEMVPALFATPPADVLGADGPRSGNPTIRAKLEAGRPQVLAWTRDRAGARGFACTGGHFHVNWEDDDFRKLILNGIAWAAGVPIPVDGIPSRTPALTRYEFIDDAIARGDLTDVRRHLRKDPGSRNRGRRPQMPPLHQAILRNQVTIAEYLLAAGADVREVDGSGRSPLHAAVERNQPGLIEKLLARKANPNRRDRSGWAPLHHAAARDRIECVQTLLNGGADPNVLSTRGGTPLHEAAASAGEDVIDALLRHGTDPTVRASSGESALDIARSFDNQAAIDRLEAATPAPAEP